VKIPTLLLDMRRETLEAGGDYLNMIDGADNVIARVNSICGSYDHAGEILDRINKYPAIVGALRALAIVDTQAPGQARVVHDGHRCRVCASVWKLSQPEQHQDWCALKGTAE
jgi:hypothetical protein